MIDDYVASRQDYSPSTLAEALTPYVYGVSEFIDQANALFSDEFGTFLIEGEVANYKLNQGKWIFFDLKEGERKLSCFMLAVKLRQPLIEGMKVRLVVHPKLINSGKFSLVVERALPIGEGNIKKSLELLKQKLAKEGLFDPQRKRPLPSPLTHIGVISSVEAAGYIDFIKILNDRWGGLKITTAHTQVQGLDAPNQIIQALQRLNQQPDLELIVLIRGGGSADDLAVFNDEALARAIATSRLPVITGIGHEIDETLADLVADLRASTPSNVAERISPDRRDVMLRLDARLHQIVCQLQEQLTNQSELTERQVADLARELDRRLRGLTDQIEAKRRALGELNPENVLARGYALLSGKLSPGECISITTQQKLIKAEVKHVETR